MRLDPRCQAAIGSAGFDHIRVDRALHKEARLAVHPRLRLEGANESLTDDPALLLRVTDASQALEELL